MRTRIGAASSSRGGFLGALTLYLLVIAFAPHPTRAAATDPRIVVLRSPSLSLGQQRLLEACIANARCAAAFHLPLPDSAATTTTSYDVRLFRHLLTRHEAELGISSASQEPFSCVSSEAPPDQACLDWWLVSLQQARFCSANQQYVLGVGCQTLEGRVSAASSPDEISWTRTSFLVMGGVLLVAVFFGTAYVVRRQMKLQNLVQMMQWMVTDLKRVALEQQRHMLLQQQYQQQASVPPAPQTVPVAHACYVGGGAAVARATPNLIL